MLGLTTSLQFLFQRAALAMILATTVFISIGFSRILIADELSPSYLQLTEIQPGTLDVHWKVPARDGNQRLALFVEFDENTQQITQPIDSFIGNVNIRRWQIARPEGLTGLTITINGLAKTNAEVLARIEYFDGISITHRLTPDATSYQLAAKPHWSETLKTYFVLGVEHILYGLDHLLFVLALLLLVPDTRKLILTITAFTLSHSITLILATLELIHLPVPPIEACIALSIVFIAAEIIHGQQGRPGITARHPWLVAFAFGLLHGLGFAAALDEIGLPQNAIVMALIVFNLGVEAGQLLFVVAVLTLWQIIKTLPIKEAVWLPRIPAYAIGSIAAFWTIERVTGFWV